MVIESIWTKFAVFKDEHPALGSGLVGFAFNAVAMAWLITVNVVPESYRKRKIESAITVDAGDLCIEDHVVHAKVIRDLAGNQFNGSVLEKRECAEANRLQFIDEFSRIERFRTA
jgi:hypothetical protein